MSETKKRLIETAAQAANVMSDKDATRLQGVIQGFALGCGAATPTDTKPGEAVPCPAARMTTKGGARTCASV